MAVRMKGARLGSQNVAALVDSGADHVLAAPWIAQDIGIDPDPNRETTLGIGGGPRRVRFADVTVHLLPPAVTVTGGGYDPSEIHEWQAEVGFFTQWEPPWSIVLGQVSFLDRFTVTFSRHAQALAVDDVSAFDDRYSQPPASSSHPPERFSA
ncbi:MAG TPA: retropepsin-like aspartic protease [Acidimicrobiales bacterium]|nr:retropepsin-like aspartic protease [Acidimicrobiales bacterium]